jgi:hypothetical protein
MQPREFHHPILHPKVVVNQRSAREAMKKMKMKMKTEREMTAGT